MSIADYSLVAPALPALRGQVMTRGFRASCPGCSPQSTTPEQADKEVPLVGPSSHQSRYVSHPGQERGSAHRTGCCWGVLGPHLPAWSPGSTENGLKTPHFQEHFSMLPLLVASLVTTLSWFLVFTSLPLVPFSRPFNVSASARVCSFLHFPLASRGRPPKDGGTREGTGKSASLAPGTVQSPGSWLR